MIGLYYSGLYRLGRVTLRGAESALSKNDLFMVTSVEQLVSCLQDCWTALIDCWLFHPFAKWRRGSSIAAQNHLVYPRLVYFETYYGQYLVLSTIFTGLLSTDLV